MWVKVAQNYSVNLDQVERVVVRVIKGLAPTIHDSPVPVQNVTRVDVEAYLSDERKYALASFQITPDCGPYEAEAKADAVFARIMRAAGDQEALLDLTQSEQSKPGTPAMEPKPAPSPIRFAM